MKMKLNDTYVEPGFIALEGDEDITSKVKIAGAVNSAKSDIYTLTYSVANVDGFQFQRSVMFWLLHLLLPVPIMENQNLAAATM